MLNGIKDILYKDFSLNDSINLLDMVNDNIINNNNLDNNNLDSNNLNSNSNNIK